MWFTTEQGLDGPVYGAADKWNGVGIFFDSFDNDGKVCVFVTFYMFYFFLKEFLSCSS